MRNLYFINCANGTVEEMINVTDKTIEEIKEMFLEAFEDIQETFNEDFIEDEIERIKDISESDLNKKDGYIFAIDGYNKYGEQQGYTLWSEVDEVNEEKENNEQEKNTTKKGEKMEKRISAVEVFETKEVKKIVVSIDRNGLLEFDDILVMLDKYMKEVDVLEIEDLVNGNTVPINLENVGSVLDIKTVISLLWQFLDHKRRFDENSNK